MKTGNLMILTDNITPWKLVEMFFESHRLRGLTPHRPFRSYLREAKSLIRDVGKEEAAVLIFKAHRLSTPYGFQFLRRLYARDSISTKPEASKRTKL